ncbi:hypothetical protein SCLCIDRAFT_26220 [Scleroderma citrinum Foug A]|uniref:Retrotransposon gag domain-containing protein n=1 Tax=Scleroderma citrinum Foug A TaxID=1036808 RepID=A0A0C2ZHG0_9AGAM|nr:hypothetical protein SCLCIDRAFT_26220 [Scleroderma citrinum Foug A]
MDWEGAVQQLIQNQQNFGQAFAQFLTHQANVGPTGPLPVKKIVATPEAYDGSPQKFHEWWSKVKVWIATTHATATNKQKAAAVYSRLEGPHAGCFAQFQALKLQSECPDEYAKDLLERAVSHKILEQVYMQGLDRTTWLTNHYTSSSGTPSGSGVPMDIGLWPYFPRVHSALMGPAAIPQQGQAVQPQIDPHNDDKRVKAVRESDDEMGIIALESELDAALRILDYRFSRTTDYIAHTIYKYRISLLQRKIEKTHKKFATSTPSPVTVSPNKYASLVVEDVATQCTMDSGSALW